MLLLFYFDEWFYSFHREKCSRTNSFIDRKKHATALFLVFLSWLFHHQAFLIEQQGFSEREAEEKQGWQSCQQWRKAGEVLEEENEYICLICMQVFQTVKLSIFPVTIPMRILDRQEISSMEYQVDLYVYISMQHITMYMHTHAYTHEYTHTNHQQAKTLMHNHTDTCTYPLPKCLSLTITPINIHAHTYQPSQIITWMHKHTYIHTNRCKFPSYFIKASR